MQFFTHTSKNNLKISPRQPDLRYNNPAQPSILSRSGYNAKIRDVFPATGRISFVYRDSSLRWSFVQEDKRDVSYRQHDLTHAEIQSTKLEKRKSVIQNL